MFAKIRIWAGDEAGNVTIDWTVIVAMIVGMSFAVMLSIGASTDQLADKTETELASRNIGF